MPELSPDLFSALYLFVSVLSITSIALGGADLTLLLGAAMVCSDVPQKVRSKKAEQRRK
jgi:hypothetical protein